MENKTLSFKDVLDKSPDIITPSIGEVVEGVVIDITKNYILVDLNQGILTGIIVGREMKDTKMTINSLKIGDIIKTAVIDEEDKNGMVCLSLRQASQRNIWDEFIEAYEEEKIIPVKITEANKGGLLVDVDGIKGFIPVSQLSPIHYPRIESANGEKIYQKLKSLVGKILNVVILSLDLDNRKMILSEKAIMETEVQDVLGDLKEGQKIKGVVSGIVSYGIFVTFNGIEGLVHISEIDWGHVSDPTNYVQVGDEIDVLVTGIDENKISLSLKQLKEDPWIKIAKNYKLNSVVEGPITRVTPFGAFMKLEEGIHGLIHLSEISHNLVKDPSDYIQVGDIKKAQIITLDVEDRRIGLSMKSLVPEPKKKVVKKESKKENDKSQKDVEKEDTKKEDIKEKKPAKKTTK